MGIYARRGLLLLLLIGTLCSLYFVFSANTFTKKDIIVNKYWSKTITKFGDGMNIPMKGDVITIDYTGTLTSGKVFDSSRDPGRRPIEGFIGVGRFIVGWDECVMSMSIGERAILTIHPKFAYGEKGKYNT